MNLPRSAYKLPIIYQLQRYQLVGKYWFLYWLGKIEYFQGKFYINYYFINKKTPDDFFENDYTGEKTIVKLEASLISLIKVGTIFDFNGLFICNSEDYITKSGMINVSFKSNKRPIKSQLRFNFKEELFPTVTDNDLEGFAYFEKKIIKNRNEYKVIIPIHVMCSYLYFRCRFITEEILCSSIFSLFDLDSFTVKEINGLKIGVLLYDNLKALPQEIYSISQFLFIKDCMGVKSINIISSYLQNIYSLIEENKVKEAYSVTEFPFLANIDIDLRGKFINDGTKKYFLAYEVKEINFRENIFTIDHLILKPKYENYNANLLAKRSFCKLNSNLKLSQKENIRMVSKKYPLDLGLEIDIYKMQINKNQELELIIINDRFRNRKFLIKRPIDTSYYYSFLTYMLIGKKFNVEFKYLNNIQLKSSGTKIKISGKSYKILILEIIYKKGFFYKIELGGYFTLTICKEPTLSKLVDIELKILIEKIINDFSFENGFYREINERDVEHYRRSYNINICDYSTAVRNKITKTIIKNEANDLKKIIEFTVAKND